MRTFALLVTIVAGLLAGAYHFRVLSLECAGIPVGPCLLGAQKPDFKDQGAGRKSDEGGVHKAPWPPRRETSRWHNPRKPQSTYGLRLSGQRAELVFETVPPQADGFEPGSVVFSGERLRPGEYKGTHYAYAPKANNCPPFTSDAMLTVQDGNRLVLRGTAWAQVAFGTCRPVAAEAFADEYVPLR